MTFGSIYGLLAVGLVLTFKTSGVFNLAYGVQAFLSAAVYYDTHIRHGWPIPLALLLAVVIVAPLGGFLLDRVLFRYLRTASSTAPSEVSSSTATTSRRSRSRWSSCSGWWCSSARRHWACGCEPSSRARA